MRRVMRLGLALAVLAALGSPAPAQTVLVGPGGIINTVVASVSVSNTTAATTLYTFQVPAGLASSPLHLRLYGTLQTANGCIGCNTGINIGVNYGTLASASVALVNGVLQPLNLATVPVDIDVIVRPTTLATTAPYLMAKYASYTSTNLAVNPLVATTQAIAVDPSGQPSLQVKLQFASAAATNTFTLLSGTLTIE